MNNPLRNQIQQFYDASTPLWLRTWGEHMHHGYYGADGSEKKDHLQAQVDLIEELLEWGDVGNPNSIVDIGCGVGGSSIHLAQKYGATADGMTLSPVQAERGNVRAKELGISNNVKVHVADAMQPPFDNNSFDLAWSCESGEHMPDKRLFLRSAFNMLKPGGRFLMATWCHRTEPPELTTKEQSFLKDMCSAYHLPYIISNPSYAQLAKEEGFKHVQIEDWTYLKALRLFARPHTIVGTSLSVTALFIIAMAYADTSVLLWQDWLIALISCLGANVYIVGLNQLTDIEIDKINKPNLPLISGLMSVKTGWTTIAASILISLIFALAGGF